MADALASGEHGVHELLGFELVAVALAADLEPFHRVPRGVLQTDHVDLAHGLVMFQHFGNVVCGIAQRLELAHQLDGIFQRELGARANRKVCGVHSIAHQHHMAVAVESGPVVALDSLEIEPSRAAQVAGIGHQLLALQVLGKELFTKGNRGILIGLVQTVGQPDVLRAFDDEGGRLVVKLVDVRLEPAVFGLLEQKGEGVVQAVGAQPDVAVGPGDDVGLKDLGQTAAYAGIDAIAGDDQIGIGEVQIGLRVLLKQQLHPQFLATRLQDVEQLFATDAHKTVTAGADHAVLEVQLNVIPMVKRLLHLIGGFNVPLAHVFERLVGKHHTPTKGVIGLVALYHGDVVVRAEFFHQQREVQAGRTTANAHDFHVHSLCFRPYKPIDSGPYISGLKYLSK